MKKTEKPETYRLASGWQKTTASVKYDDGEWLVQSETVKDMLGRTITRTSNVYNNAGLLVRTVNHDGSSVVYAYNELNERVANIRIGAGQTLDFNAQSFILDDVIELDKYLISLTTERTENTEGEWWKCAESISYMPGENALTTSVQRVQLTGLTLENNSKSISIDADGNTSVTTESLNPASVSKVVTSINTTLDITNVSRGI